MKKINSVFVMLIAILVISTFSCEKTTVGPEDPIEDPVEGILKTSDLVGTWKFVSLEFQGKVYSDCEDPYLNAEYTATSFNLNDVTETTMIISNNCYVWEFDYTYELKNDTITVNDLNFQFEIVNAATFDNNTLKLKLINQGGNTTCPISGIYTFDKQ